MAIILQTYSKNKFKKYMLDINIPMKLTKFKEFGQICMIARLTLLPLQPYFHILKHL